MVLKRVRVVLQWPERLRLEKSLALKTLLVAEKRRDKRLID